MESGDFIRDSVPMSFDQHSSTVILDMMRSMSYMPGLGLGRCQHGHREFITVLDHDCCDPTKTCTKANFTAAQRLLSNPQQQLH